MPKDGVITESEWQWLSDAFKEDDDWRAEIKKFCGDKKYMRGIDPKKHKEVRMSRKEMTEKLEQLTKRVDKFESRMDKLKEAAYYEYYYSYGFFGPKSREMPASTAIEKILNHLKLEVKCEPAKEQECHLVSILPVRKPKKKPKKKAKKKK